MIPAYKWKPLNLTEDQTIIYKNKWASLLPKTEGNWMSMMGKFLDKETEYLKSITKEFNNVTGSWNNKDVGPFMKFVFPIVRKDSYRSDYEYYSPLGLQPISNPSSIYYYDFISKGKKELETYTNKTLNPDFVGEKVSSKNTQEELFKEPVKETRASLLGPWCVPCGSDVAGKHKRMCPVNK